MKTLRLLKYHYTRICNFTTSIQAFKKPSRLNKKQSKPKISLSPKFLDNVKLWSESLEAEKKAQFQKLDELIAEKASWREIERRGLCVGNLILSEKYTDVSHGDIVVLTGVDVERVKWLKPGTPITVHQLETGGHLKVLSEGHVAECSRGTLKLCVYEEKDVLFSEESFVVTPSVNSGSIHNLIKILKNPETLSSDSVHLVNLAYRSITMPSIHDRKLQNLTESLNPSQSAAVSAALNSQRNLLCIQGPPGTGKTHVIAEIVHQLTAKKKKVLVCAPTHAAVENAFRASEKRMSGSGSQLGVLSHAREAFQKHKNAQKLFAVYNALTKTPKGTPDYASLSIQCYNLRSSIFKDIFCSKRAIFSTLGTSSIQKLPEFGWDADVILVDEAAQCTEPATWVPVLTTPKCKKLVLVGDQKQLPAVVLSETAQKNKLNVSLMEKLEEEFSSTNVNILLKEQYRMNQKIMAWSNEVFYDNQLTAHPNVSDITLSDICPNVRDDQLINNPIFMINMDKSAGRTKEHLERHSFVNIDETNVVRDYVNRLVVDVGLDTKQIAVITPYYAQIEQLRVAIGFPIDVNTVDAFQGHERQVVIFCLVRDNKDGIIGFLRETRRLNVAITRAKRQFVLVGSGRMMQKDKHLRRLYKYLNNENLIFGKEILDDFDDCGLPDSSQKSFKL